MGRAVCVARFVAFATAVYIALICAVPARAWDGGEAPARGELAQALADLAASWAVSASLAAPLAAAILAGVAQAVSRARIR